MTNLQIVGLLGVLVVLLPLIVTKGKYRYDFSHLYRAMRKPQPSFDEVVMWAASWHIFLTFIVSAGALLNIKLIAFANAAMFFAAVSVPFIWIIGISFVSSTMLVGVAGIAAATLSVGAGVVGGAVSLATDTMEYAATGKVTNKSVSVSCGSNHISSPVRANTLPENGDGRKFFLGCLTLGFFGIGIFTNCFVMGLVQRVFCLA